MEKYRIGNDIKVKWVIFRNGKKPEDFTKATIQELRLNNVTSGDSLLPTYSVSGNVITVEYPASQQKKSWCVYFNFKIHQETFTSLY